MKNTNKIFTLLYALAVVLAVSFVVLAGENAAAGDILDNLTDSAKGGGLYEGGTTDISLVAGRVIGAMLSLTGVLFMGIIVYGGNLWMTARGNEQQVEKAHKLITNAVVGLLLIIGSYAITWFLVDALSSSSIGAGEPTESP